MLVIGSLHRWTAGMIRAMKGGCLCWRGGCLIQWPLYRHVFRAVVYVRSCTVVTSASISLFMCKICLCCYLRIDSRVLRMPDDTSHEMLKVHSSVCFLLAPLLTTPANACMCRLHPWMFTYIYCTILHVYACLPCLQPLC